ncbi:hypothetical protein [Mycoplasma sp. 2248]|uniref:hypothetical protein n=1 Tax=Mycoplasma sp. 2248 TaxID=3108528 RepID=UPI002B1CE78C|nr:hypothetical protein [Mycoplasma sp. 2248]MEA4191391.1 hypothetical protein [Mycoplasma sp. 2248]
MNLKNKKKWILLPLSAAVSAPLALLTTVSASTETVTTTNPERGKAGEGILNWDNSWTYDSIQAPNLKEYAWDDSTDTGTYDWKLGYNVFNREERTRPDSYLNRSIGITKTPKANGEISWTLDFFKEFAFIGKEGNKEDEQHAYFMFALTDDLKIKDGSQIKITRQSQDRDGRISSLEKSWISGENPYQALGDNGVDLKWYKNATTKAQTWDDILYYAEVYNVKTNPYVKGGNNPKLLGGEDNSYSKIADRYDSFTGQFEDGLKTYNKDFTSGWIFQTRSSSRYKFTIEFTTESKSNVAKGAFSGVFQSVSSRQLTGKYVDVILRGERAKKEKQFDNYPVVIKQTFNGIDSDTQIPTSSAVLTKTITAPVYNSGSLYSKVVTFPETTVTSTNNTREQRFLIKDIVNADPNNNYAKKTDNTQRGNSVDYTPPQIEGYTMTFRKNINGRFSVDNNGVFSKFSNVVEYDVVYTKNKVADKSALQQEYDLATPEFYAKNPYADSLAGFQTKYREQLSAAKAVLNDNNATQEQVNTALRELQSARNDLNGQKLVDAVKEDALAIVNNPSSFLSETQKTEAKKQIAAAEFLSTATTIKNNIEQINSLRETIKLSNEALTTPNYTEARKEPNKDEFDQTLTNAKKYENIDKFNEDQSEAATAKKRLTAAYNELNGETRLKEAKRNANADIDALTNLSEADKKTAKAEVEKQTTIANVANKLLEAQKQDAKNKIDQLTNLSDAQRQAAKNLIDSQDTNTLDKVQAIVDNATTVNNGVPKLTAAKAIKTNNETRYTEASPTPNKSNFDNAISALNDLTTYTSFDTAYPNLQTKLTDLSNATDNLNGVTNLNTAKTNAIAAIDKLSYLSDTQKDAAKADINAKEAITDVNNIVKNATLMNNAKEALDKASKAQETIAYTKASEQPKANFDTAKANVEAIKDITNFNKPVNKIVDLTNKLNDATATLDGRTELDAAKEEALKEVAKLPYLSDEPYSSDSEKFKASEAIRNATDIETLAKAIEDAKALNKANYDKKVDELNDLTNQYLQSTYGTDASNKHRENVVKAINQFNSKAFSDANGEAAIAKAQNLLDLVDSITTNKSRNNFEALAGASDLANMDTLANAVIKHNYFETSTKAKNKLNLTDLKNIKQLVSKVGDIQGLNVLTTAITKALKNNSPMVIWPYIMAASVATWLLGAAIFIFGKKK